MLELVRRFFRCPDSVLNVDINVPVSGAVKDALEAIDPAGSSRKEFLPTPECEKLVESLLMEEYPQARSVGLQSAGIVRNAYYLVRPFLSVSVRRILQRAALKRSNSQTFPHWPVDFTSDEILKEILAAAMAAKKLDRIPFIWFWPDGHKSCAVLTHDVETRVGLKFCPELMKIDDSHGIKSSFQIIPENRYEVTEEQLDHFRLNGFEINVHDLNHDGQLFSDRDRFLERAKKISHYGKHFRAHGFRAGALYRNQQWFDQLDFAYDMSVPNNGRFDPQPGGCCTVFPYFIGNLLEIPVTAIQDYTLFNVLNDYSISVWRQQIQLISEHHGLTSIIVHPDYLTTDRAKDTYTALLQHISALRDTHGLWVPLPGDIDAWWRQRHQMKLVEQNGKWVIQGENTNRARVALAQLKDGGISYLIE